MQIVNSHGRHLTPLVRIEPGRDTGPEYQGHQSLSSAENQVLKPLTVHQSLVSTRDFNLTATGKHAPGMTGHSRNRLGIERG
jgi:hypothetical protein